MDIRIGVTYTAKELDLELADDADTSALQADVEAALTGANPVLWVVDKRGRKVGVPAEKIAYVEIGSPESARRIGFGS